MTFTPADLDVARADLRAAEARVADLLAQLRAGNAMPRGVFERLHRELSAADMWVEDARSLELGIRQAIGHQNINEAARILGAKVER